MEKILEEIISWTGIISWSVILIIPIISYGVLGLKKTTKDKYPKLILKLQSYRPYFGMIANWALFFAIVHGIIAFMTIKDIKMMPQQDILKYLTGIIALVMLSLSNITAIHYKMCPQKFPTKKKVLKVIHKLCVFVFFSAVIAHILIEKDDTTVGFNTLHKIRMI